MILLWEGGAGVPALDGFREENATDVVGEVSISPQSSSSSSLFGSAGRDVVREGMLGVARGLARFLMMGFEGVRIGGRVVGRPLDVLRLEKAEDKSEKLEESLLPVEKSREPFLVAGVAGAVTKVPKSSGSSWTVGELLWNGVPLLSFFDKLERRFGTVGRIVVFNGGAMGLLAPVEVGFGLSKKPQSSPEICSGCEDFGGACGALVRVGYAVRDGGCDGFEDSMERLGWVLEAIGALIAGLGLSNMLQSSPVMVFPVVWDGVGRIGAGAGCGAAWMVFFRGLPSRKPQ